MNDYMMDSCKILIIEDNTDIAEGLSQIMKRYGYDPFILKDFKNIDKEVKQINPHLILLDINLPYYDGFYWCVKIREISTCPIIIISAREGVLDQVLAIENGADDYICKPFANDVVIAKVKSQIRRTYGDYNSDRAVVAVNDLRLYTDRLLLSYKESKISLSAKEMILLQTLMQNHNKVIRREVLLEKVWDNQSFVEENTLNVNITRIRKKMAQLGLNNVLETVRSLGYRLNIDQN